MRKKLISLGLISVASVLAISGCSAAVTARVNEPAVVQSDGDHRGIPHYRASELPSDDEIYDLTKEINYGNIRAATEAELDEFLMSVAGPSLVKLVKETFPELYSYIAKYNVLTQRELYDLAGIAGKIIKFIRGESVDPAELVVDIATKVDLDKFYYIIHSFRNDSKAYAELKRFVVCANTGSLVQVDYRTANAKMSGNDLADLAKAEAKVWDNFKVGDDDLETFERIQEFFNDKDVRVFLRFVNLLARSLAKNLTSHEIGFVFSNLLHLIPDPEYAELCMRYMLNNADAFIHHMGAVFAGINVTNGTWVSMLRGLHTFVNKIGASGDYFDHSSFIAIDYCAQKIFEQDTQFVIDSIDPHGIQVLFKFVGNFLKAMPKSFVKSVVRNYVDNPDAIDYSVLQDVYYEVFGRLKGSDKAALVAQAERFNIDLEHLFEPEKPQPEPGVPFIELDTYERYVRKGKSFALTAIPPEVEGEEEAVVLTFESSNTSVATISVVDNVCTVTAVDTGSAEIVVTGGGAEARCKVYVVGEDDQSPGLIALMQLLGNNLVNPFIEYFTTGLKSGRIYTPSIVEEGYDPEDYAEDFSQPEFSTGYKKLIFRQGDQITNEDIVNYVNEDETLTIEMDMHSHVHSGEHSFKDRGHRGDITIEGSVNTSKVGEGYIIVKYSVTLPIDVYLAPGFSTYGVLNFKYDFEWKLYYYVIDKTIDAYASGFRDELCLYDGSSYHIVDGNDGGFIDAAGNAAFMDYKGVLNVKKGAAFVDDGRLLLRSRSSSMHKYDGTLKRYEEIADKESDYKAEQKFYKLSDLDTSKVGLHYGYYNVVIKDSHDEDYYTAKMVFVYNVVEELNYEFVGGFYDPGFGW